MLEIKSATNVELILSDPIILSFRIKKSRTRVAFRIVKKEAVPVLFGATFIDRVIRSVHPAERKLVPLHSPPVPILMVYGAIKVAGKEETRISNKKPIKM